MDFDALEVGQEVLILRGGVFARVFVVAEIDQPEHPYLDNYPACTRKVAVDRGPGTPVEVVRFDELRFG